MGTLEIIVELLNDFGPWMLGYVGCAYLLYVNRILNKELRSTAVEATAAIERFNVKIEVLEREVSRIRTD